MIYKRLMTHKIFTTYKKALGSLAICLLLMMVVTSCSSDKPTYLEPHLSTLAASDITRTEATLNGIVSIEGETDMPQLTFRYGTTEAMSQTTKTLTTDNSDGNASQVSLRLLNLPAGTTYYYMLQGYNGRTTLTSNVVSFTTLPNEKPTLGEAQILSHGPMSVVVGYEITDNGGEAITETGCYYALSSSASTTERNKVVLSNYQGEKGQQKVLIANLDRNASYQIWPYAISRAGEAIGEPITFTTSDAISLHEAGVFTSLMGNNLYEYTSLTLSGPMNGDDLNCLRKMMGQNDDGTTTPGKLSSIDMTEVQIVAGGGSYGSSRYTEDHVIGQGLFANCTRLEKVSLPADATTLEKDAFTGCTSLQEIEIPASVASILPSSGCTALEYLNVSGANANYKSQDGVLLNGNGTEIIWFPMGKKGEYTLPSTITAIGNYAFKECSIETFILPDNLKEIGQGAFMDSRVKEVRLPANLQQIPTSTFQGCTQLKVVRIGKKTELISDYAFDLCPLTDIYVEATLPPVCNKDAFSTRGTSFLNTCKIHVSKGREGFYQASNGWKDFSNILSD